MCYNQVMAERKGEVTITEEVTQSEASKRVGVTPNAVKFWIKTGKLPARKCGGIILIRVSDLEKVNAESLGGSQRKRFQGKQAVV